MNIYVSVRGQSLYLNSTVDEIVEGSANFARIHFDLDADWNDLTTFAQFSQGSNAYNVYLDEENCVYLPPEVESGHCYLMLYGVSGNGTARIITAPSGALRLNISPNRLIADASSTDISQSLYDQLVSMVNQFINNTATVAETRDYLDI